MTNVRVWICGIPKGVVSKKPKAMCQDLWVIEATGQRQRQRQNRKVILVVRLLQKRKEIML